ncbi:isochorismatase family protein [Sediminibacillus halophilus]|uniref:Nicotinamidase-related amidase n=1 Tax=Sediminibacillus halophilus TaxID=482461 RepID=A0A1G9RTJ5_9BACI|nr:isochorismatase family protein [Sediminibacillus halophilus]SDM26494.1 Nicotinamidase-related amidase [Sediminibacillus halophilus]
MKQALLVIDTQQDLMEGSKVEEGVVEKEKIIANINLVIEKAKSNSALIVFVRDLEVADGKGAGFQIHEDINVPSEAAIFDKEATNSFYGTPLQQYLVKNKVEHLVVMGCKTEHCIDTAVRTATINHFDVTLVGDGHTTSDTEILPANQIILHHNKTLHGHYNVDHFSIVRNANEDLFQPEHNKYRESDD